MTRYRQAVDNTQKTYACVCPLSTAVSPQSSQAQLPCRLAPPLLLPARCRKLSPFLSKLLEQARERRRGEAWLQASSRPRTADGRGCGFRPGRGHGCACAAWHLCMATQHAADELLAAQPLSSCTLGACRPVRCMPLRVDGTCIIAWARRLPAQHILRAGGSMCSRRIDAHAAVAGRRCAGAPSHDC